MEHLFLMDTPLSHQNFRTVHCTILNFVIFFAGVGCLLFAVPKLLKGPYQPDPVIVSSENLEFCSATRNLTEAATRACVMTQSSSIHVFFFSLSQIIMGAGITPLYTLGTSYLDENVSPKNTPIYIGIWYLCTFAGPAAGFFVGGLLQNKYVDFVMVSINSITLFKSLTRIIDDVL